MIRKLLKAAQTVTVLLGIHSPALAEEPPTPITLADLYSEQQTRDAAISPSGRYLAVASSQAAHDIVLVLDLDTGTRTAPISIARNGAGAGTDTRISHVYWKSDDRLLFRVQVRPKGESPAGDVKSTGITTLGDRLFAINRDGSKSTRLLADIGFLSAGALNLGAIGSMLPRDPDHIIMIVVGFFGPALYRVNVQDGTGTIIETAEANVVAWWPDVDGEPVVRVLRAYGTIRFQRKQTDGKWKEFYRIKVKEMRERPEYEAVGPSREPGKYYVLARPPGRDRQGVYLYDLTKEEFGEPLAENPEYDIFAAQVARDGAGLLSHCYVAHVRICELRDARSNAHMKGLRKFFQETASIYITDVSADSNTMVLFVEGPGVPPSFYYYRVNTKRIEFIGLQRQALFNKIAPIAMPVNWKTRDGRTLTGYLTKPAGSEKSGKLPLVVMPHGGPEMRDWLQFSNWVQYLVAQGYAVFQPNFRGSDGYGRAFAESGYGQWGLAMQDDITDGLAALVQQEIVDPARVCIVGASYGGYAALAGATLTPDLYRCAVSIAGVSDLSGFIRWYKSEHGRNSPGADYWERAIGDPGMVKAQLRAASPVHLAAQVKADVLLIHGTGDPVVPIEQSKDMKRALEKAARRVELLELAGEGHSYWSDENEMLALEKIQALLLKNLGPGFVAPSTPDDSHAK